MKADKSKFKYKPKMSQFYDKEGVLSIYLNPDAEHYEKTLFEGEKMVFIYLRDSNPHSVFEEQRALDNVVFEAIKEIGNHYFETFVVDCQAGFVQK